ncbi:MAG: 2-amino-4-hydroxy-6-hydroxymethyldihydropteridine diphosphokinase [Nitrosospira sp.]|nr:2-amino-4-hydroxy-6-hydroxymethyldihydropteridine diphosphokinase [Nitrosospira sp.]
MTSDTEAQVFCHAFIALGSNLANPALQVRRAFAELSQLPASRLLNCSAIYRSAPVGRLDQPDFINAVAQIETSLAPHDLLKALLEIEHRCGRVRTSLNAPRILDLDLLLYADLQCDEPGLTLPHPRMHQRAFVLQPLLEIAPDCCIPGHGAAAELLAACAGQRLERE